MSEHPPLWIMATRLAPFIARGDISLSEAHDCIAEHIVRCRWQEYGDQFDLTLEWLDNVLAREAERARHG
jgi:hypothetical protein